MANNNTIDISAFVNSLKNNIPASALEVVKACMQFAEKTNATGEEKAELVLLLVEHPAVVSAIPENIKQGLQILVDNNLVAPTLSVVCEAAKGKLDLAKVKTCVAMLPGFFNAFKACLGGASGLKK